MGVISDCAHDPKRLKRGLRHASWDLMPNPSGRWRFPRASARRVFLVRRARGSGNPRVAEDLGPPAAALPFSRTRFQIALWNPPVLEARSLLYSAISTRAGRDQGPL